MNYTYTEIIKSPMAAIYKFCNYTFFVRKKWVFSTQIAQISKFNTIVVFIMLFFKKLIFIIILAALLGINSLLAQQNQIKELQLDLIEMGLFKEEANGEMSDSLKEAISSYIKQQKITGNIEDIISDLSLLVYDVDLETRIRQGKAILISKTLLPAKYKIEIYSYQHIETTALSKRVLSQSYRLYVEDKLFLAGHLPLFECCEIKNYTVKDVEISVIEGISSLQNCSLLRFIISVKQDEIQMLGSPQTCAPNAIFIAKPDYIELNEIQTGQLVPKRFALLNTGEKLFERHVLSQKLNGLSAFEGKLPLEINEKGARAMYNPALLEALSTLLEPETLGWAMKMKATQAIERRGDLLFIQGQFQQDETMVSIAIDLEKQAVHICTIHNGLTRFNSTLLEETFTDPDSSCPLNVEEAENIWGAMDVLTDKNSTKIFSIEGIYNFIDDKQDKIIIKPREVVFPDGKSCKIDAISFSERAYTIKSSCQNFIVKLIKDNKYEIDGEEAEKVE